MRSTVCWICSDCLRAQNLPALQLRASRLSAASRSFSSQLPLASGQATAPKDDDEVPQTKDQEDGAMSRRLSELAEETMDTGSQSDRKLMQDAGFSEELKRQLEERISQSAFKAENQRVFSEVNMPSSAGRGTREQAAAQPWTGNESLHDSALRMLDDSHKRLRSPSIRAPQIPNKVNLKPAPKKAIPVGQRLANARDKTSIYSLARQTQMSDEDREKMRKELKERFTPGARPMPTTLSGLASLANERIEDAIARGQFKNIPRGKGKNVERDYAANSPFLDTTEYFMNKIIQKQEIVPPWIEKQQEVVKTVSNFRSRLRKEWRRHVARSISSKGGSLEDQIRRAQAYALAEEKQNPQQVQVERLSEIESDGTLSTVTVVETPPSVTSEAGSNMTITVTESAPEDAPQVEDARPTASLEGVLEAPAAPAADTPASSIPQSVTDTQPPRPHAVVPMAYPFRDPQWERLENAYHTLAVAELNNLTRSYNLMAPKIAQKPYYSLSRELARCFADVAPTVADEIAQRARAPTVKMEIIGHREGGIMEKFGTGHVAKVRDEDIQKKGYGFKQFWKDLFRKEEQGMKLKT